MGVHCEGFQRATADFVCFHALWSRPQARLPPSTSNRFARLGSKYGKSAAQIILRWHIQDGNIVIPGSKNPDHIRANFDLLDFALTADEMSEIAQLNKNAPYYTSGPIKLKMYAKMVPPVDNQK